MSTELVYEIARYTENPGSEELIERVQVFADGGTFRLRDEHGTEHLCSGTDVSSIVASTEALHELRANQLAKITGEPSVVNRLPLLLTVPLDRANPTDTYRAAQVNGVDWRAYETSDGVRMLPYGDSEFEPKIDPCWIYASFIETDSRTSGYFSGQLGLITPDVVADFLDPDEDPNRLSIRPRGDDAEVVADWLVRGGFYSDFWGDGTGGQALMTQLFVEAVCNGDGSCHIDGIKLAAGVFDGDFGSSIGAEWTLHVQLNADVVDRILDQLSAISPQLADIVMAGRDPNSQQGRARAEALQQVIEAYYT